MKIPIDVVGIIPSFGCTCNSWAGRHGCRPGAGWVVVFGEEKQRGAEAPRRPKQGTEHTLVVSSGNTFGQDGVVLLADLAATSRAVGATSARREKVDLLAVALRRLGPEEVPAGVAFLSGELRQRQIGVGWAALRDAPAGGED